jgi:hypothetical protein
VLEATDRVLQFDYRGAPQTIGVMRRAVMDSQGHLAVRRLAEEISQEIDSKDYGSEYLAILYFVLAHTRYMRDPRTVELVKAPHIIATDIIAGRVPSIDCDDSAAFIASLVLSVGGMADFATLAFRNQFVGKQRQYSHVLARAQEPKTRQWVVLDAVAAERTPKMLADAVASKIWPIA